VLQNADYESARPGREDQPPLRVKLKSNYGGQLKLSFLQ